MINDGFPFWRNVISNVLDEIQVQNVVALAKHLFDDSYLLSGQEDAKRIKKQIESMGRHASGVVGIIFLDIGITDVEVLDVPAEELKLEFVVNLWQLVEPVHTCLDLFYYLEVIKKC